MRINKTYVEKKIKKKILAKFGQVQYMFGDLSDENVCLDINDDVGYSKIGFACL